MPAPTWVTAVPSAGSVEAFARSLAERLGLPFVDALSAVVASGDAAAPQNSAQQLANAYAGLSIRAGTDVGPGPVLLVDDLVDSGWTLTVAGWLLRTHGSGDVHPYALAAASARDG